MIRTNPLEKVVEDSISKVGVPEEKPSKKEVWRMFDRISERYDLLNRLLSFGQDIIWRKHLTANLSDHPQQKILDIATGTADVLLSIVKDSRNVKYCIGIDMALKMLEFGRRKIRERKLSQIVKLLPGDAMLLPFLDYQFHAVSIAFGIRNVLDVELSLAEIYRVLKEGGRLLILEFSIPKNRIFKELYLFYFRYILPKIGSFLSGDRYAYRYLNQTVEAFPYGEAFCDLMKRAGFKNIETKPLSFGIATLYRGDKIPS